MCHRRGQKERDGSGEQARDWVGVAAPDRFLLSSDLTRDLVQAAPEGIDIAAELVALIQIEVEGELLVLDLKLVKLPLDGGTEVRKYRGDGGDVVCCPVGED